MPLPQETPIGLMAAIGMSPKPTDPPGLPRGLPRELMPRQQKTTLPLPPPGYYCGLVNGDPANLLTCVNARANCVHQGTAIGCCISSAVTDCTNIPSSCIPYGASCDAACMADPRILKCVMTTEPYCGTYDFGGGSSLVGCRPIASVTSKVQQLSDYYASVYGPDWRTRLPASSSSIVPGPSSGGSSATSTTNSPGGSPTSPGNGGQGGDNNNSNKSLSSGAIAGIVVGACAGVGGIAAFFVWYFCVKRKRDDTAGTQPNPTHGPPPPQEPQYGPPPNMAAGYYSPPIQDNKPPSDGPQPPSYGYEKPQQPNMAEMPGSGLQPQQQPSPQGQAADYYNQRASMGPPSPLSAGSTAPGSPNGMHPTHAGPVPEQIYEMGPGR
ncbi:hypothetical protein PRK78_002521 [Emydomyces testavorans]|uniref:Uncharacterized protein n=1 Tax=Emydomyces testavorans TaxID=2070801 RepID=A0AAF0DEG0_9EURO|nr:hypothetical protein PRK78_002521 [Emydomyces testavorans]